MENKILEIDGKFLVKFYNGHGDVIGKKWCDTRDDAEKAELDEVKQPSIENTNAGENTAVTKSKKVKKSK